MTAPGNCPRRCLQTDVGAAAWDLHGLINYSCRKSAEAQPNAAPFLLQSGPRNIRQWSSFVAAGDGGLSPYGDEPAARSLFGGREGQQIPSTALRAGSRGMNPLGMTRVK